MKSNFVYKRFNRSPPVGHFFFFFLVRKIALVGIELTSQRVRGLRGTSELPGRPVSYVFVDSSQGYLQFTRKKKSYSINACKATSYAVKKMISENGFSVNQSSKRIFASTRSYLPAYQNKKGNKKVVFHQLLGGVCMLYSIGESRLMYSLHNLLYVLDDVVTNNTSRRTAACRLIA